MHSDMQRVTSDGSDAGPSLAVLGYSRLISLAKIFLNHKFPDGNDVMTGKSPDRQVRFASSKSKGSKFKVGKTMTAASC